MEYELMFLIDEEQKPKFDEIKTNVHQLVEKLGGKWIGEGVEFERKMAYRINHKWRGIYFVQRFTLPTAEERGDVASVNEEITRQMNLQNNILRYLVVRSEDLPPLEDFAKSLNKKNREGRQVLKEKGEKIDSKLEEALNI